MRRFRDTEELGPTLTAAAERLGISATAIEKDYWVSEILRVLARRHGDDFIFKGGTSLSKGYRLVERFSEDIDVLVLPGDRGRGSTDRLMKEMGEAAAAGIGAAAAPSADRRPGGIVPTTSAIPRRASRRPSFAEASCWKWASGERLLREGRRQ